MNSVIKITPTNLKLICEQMKRDNLTYKVNIIKTKIKITKLEQLQKFMRSSW